MYQLQTDLHCLQVRIEPTLGALLFTGDGRGDFVAGLTTVLKEKGFQKDPEPWFHVVPEVDFTTLIC